MSPYFNFTVDEKKSYEFFLHFTKSKSKQEKQKRERERATCREPMLTFQFAKYLLDFNILDALSYLSAVWISHSISCIDTNTVHVRVLQIHIVLMFAAFTVHRKSTNHINSIWNHRSNCGKQITNIFQQIIATHNNVSAGVI